MRAAVLTSVDGAFELRDVPDPVGGEKVLVRVRAAGVNFADVLVRRGRGWPIPGLPPAIRRAVGGRARGGRAGEGLPAARLGRGCVGGDRAGAPRRAERRAVRLLSRPPAAARS